MWREAWKEQMLIAENMIKLGLGSSAFISSFERQVILDVRIMYRCKLSEYDTA